MTVLLLLCFSVVRMKFICPTFDRKSYFFVLFVIKFVCFLHVDLIKRSKSLGGGSVKSKKKNTSKANN